MAIERLVPGTVEWQAYYANHITRYKFALEQLTFKRVNSVLDAACGVGYGSKYLANSGIPKVIAVDRSKEALSIANNQFKSDNVHFLEDDCHTLQNASKYAPFDAVVSFETLEHLPDPALFLSAINKVLQPEGSLIISTPNIYVSSPSGIVDWDFHEKEYTPDELYNLINNSGFKNIKIYGQQLTSIGRLRENFRSELNRLNSNPFQRLGRFFQVKLKNVSFPAILPEQEEDFEIIDYTSKLDIIKSMGSSGPFVLIAVCEK